MIEGSHHLRGFISYVPTTHPPTHHLYGVFFSFPLFPPPPSTTFRLYIQALHHGVFFIHGESTPLFLARRWRIWSTSTNSRAKARCFAQKKNSRTVVHGRDGGCNETSHT